MTTITTHESLVTGMADEPSRWQREMGRAITHVPELLAELGIAAPDVPVDPAVLASFPLRVPRSFVRRMRHGDPADPLLRQVLAVADEGRSVGGFGPDPVGDRGSVVASGLLHKYHGRALLVVTGACAVHCRYCFRRAFPYRELALTRDRIDDALAWLHRDRSITEVILSGGDPLSLSNPRLAELVARIEAIPHLRRLRFHTRLPVVLPERVDDGLLRTLSGRTRPLSIVVHCNHPNEIDAEVADAFAALRGAGATLLNQSVLLRGINDSADTLIALSESLFAAGVLPYYLHLFDPVAGAAHFDVDTATGRRLIEQISGRLPGYLVPRLAREIPGEPAKRVLNGRTDDETGGNRCAGAAAT